MKLLLLFSKDAKSGKDIYNVTKKHESSQMFIKQQISIY